MENPVKRISLAFHFTGAVAAFAIFLSPTAILAQDSANESPGKSIGNADGADVLRLRVVPGQAWAPVTFDFVRGVIIFQANINGHQATVLLDNGTEKSAVDAGFARRVGLRLDKGPGLAAAGAGTIAFSRTNSTVFQVPGAFQMTGKLVAFDMRPISKALGREVNAILGGDAFNMLAVMLRPSTRQLSLISSGAIKFKGPDVVEFPLAPHGVIDASINGTPVKLAVDMGYSGFVRLSDPVWGRIFPHGQHSAHDSVSTTADGATTRSRTMYGNVSLGRASAMSAPVANGYVATNPVDGLLGTGVLLSGDVLVDMPKGKLTLITPRNKPPGDQAP